ncbi:hypothetical protein AYL99_00257 [Fonsecaea erecta]|uniref:Protein kinase domain-containing protein n=1 Tax=Fonsecaea erecta TaxID=1367422 RepID=A0A178ZZ37_9EURO|nr:hypothetical protein AYL99_00257 [Fonsecaea erecta]OAP64285.1 hypothetical protein AYL99_00257 [Fonsecaea erecta]
MANSEAYAIFYPEADGYLFCSSLFAGTERATSIVRSVVDNQLCPQEHQAHGGVVSTQERHLLCRILVWHVLDQLLEGIGHLHRGSPSASHNDLHPANFYLHFPTPESRLPEVFIGDLGLSRPVDESVLEVIGNPPKRRLRNPNRVRQEEEQARRV